MVSRREFLEWTGAALPFLGAGRAEALCRDDPRVNQEGPAVAKTGSDVGTLFPFIYSQASKTHFPLSFLNNQFKDVSAWKRQARGKLLELLHYSPAKWEPRPEVVEKVDKGDHVREKVIFNTTPDIRVPAYVFIPKKGRLPAPALVALHDHGGFYLWGKEKLIENEDEHPVMADFKKQYYGGVSIASALVRQGYVVIVIDMFYWGERRLILDDDPADWRQRPRSISAERIAAFNRRAGQSEELVGRTILAAGFTWPGIIFWDDVRTVDYLITRPEVDPKRIGCVGLSVGGLRSCHLAALDDRIKAAVVVGWMASFPAQLKNRVRHTIGHTKLVPGLYRYLDYPDVATLAMPAALLIINGKKDQLFDLEGVRQCFDKIGACYNKAEIGDKVRARFYDTPHEFNNEMQTEAWEWLQKWI